MSQEPQAIQAATEPDRLAGLVAIIIALATLVAALAGFLQADASNQASDRRDQAEQLSLQALASSQSAQQDAQVNLQTFERYIEQRTQGGNALLASLYAGSDTARQDALSRESERWSTLADSTLKLTDIDPAGDLGPRRIRPSRAATLPTRRRKASDSTRCRMLPTSRQRSSISALRPTRRSWRPSRSASTCSV